MKRVVFAFVALAATTAIAAAADLARRAPYYPASAPVYAPLFSWTGFYIGINGGTFNCGFNCGAGLATDNVSFHTNILRAGVNYKF